MQLLKGTYWAYKDRAHKAGAIGQCGNDLPPTGLFWHPVVGFLIIIINAARSRGLLNDPSTSCDLLHSGATGDLCQGKATSGDGVEDGVREGVGDVLARRREMKYNDFRRARNLNHYGNSFVNTIISFFPARFYSLLLLTIPRHLLLKLTAG